mgnify:CR=1 FL=1
MTINTPEIAPEIRYHHGNLRKTLLNEAGVLIAEQGIETLSLRKLAEKVGVSRTAAYHHFKGKDDLLCAIAAESFRSRRERLISQLKGSQLSEREKLNHYVCDYMSFATCNPEEYELMFGRCIWKQSTCTQELQDIAYATFQYQVGMVEHWQRIGLLSGDSPVKTAQILWGTLHGIAKLFIDGIYTDVTRVEEIALGALPMFIAPSD